MRSLLATVTVCLLLSAPAAAQTRNRRSTTQRRRAPAPATRLDQTQLNAARLQLAEVNKDLTRFLYLYGRLSKDLELTSAQAESADVTGRAKTSLVENIRAMGARLDKLEAQFRFTSGLDRHYRSLEGVSREAEAAAQQVNANRFDQAGRTLLAVSIRLTDTLVEL